jgi:hypothetical protein
VSGEIKPSRLPAVFTEEMASQKMCPLSAPREKQFACRGSRCAAWQWTIWDSRFGLGPTEPIGYCGLIRERGSPIALFHTLLSGADPTTTKPKDDDARKA